MPQDIQLRNVSHSALVELVFMRLTGRDFRETGAGMSNFGEGLTVHFLPNQKAVLEYRGQKWDVTQSLNNVLKKTRNKFKG